jgi:hypothetical protein
MLEMPGLMRKSTLNPKQVLRWGGIQRDELLDILSEKVNKIYYV